MNIYPNPFTDYTTISYTVASTDFVKMEVFDALGRQIATPVNGMVSSGDYSFRFNLKDYNSGAAGIYILKMSIGDKVITKYLNILK